MKIGIVAGSIRDESQSERIANYINDILKENDTKPEVEFISLRSENIPIWDESIGDNKSSLSIKWKSISARLLDCEGFVFITPEWAGMVPPHLKNMLLLCSNGELSHKPAQIISISSGMGGTYPVTELRTSGYKNNFIMWLPDHVILRNVKELFVEDKPSELDVKLTKRIKYSLRMLIGMAEAMTPVRDNVQDLETYGYGM